MERDWNPPNVLAMVGPPVIAAGMIWLLHQLPGTVIDLLEVWLLASFPLGVLFGHCSLGEE